jgi:hypothetical protein
MPRTPAHQVNKRQRALAIKRLEGVLKDLDAPPHAVVSAGRALMFDDRDPESDVIERDSDELQKCVILPDNEREANVRYGLNEEGQTIVIVPRGCPMEIQPESHYAGVEKPIGVVAARRRARGLAVPDAALPTAG